MNLSKKFEELVIKQLESFGCSMGVTHLVMYLASAKQGTKASFEMIGQWPQIDKLLISIEDDPSLKVSSPNRRWYPLQENDILGKKLSVKDHLLLKLKVYQFAAIDQLLQKMLWILA